MSIVWDVSPLKLPLLGLGDESPIAAKLDAHAEYDRWLVTTKDKKRMVLVAFTDGWYAQETADGSAWRWTQQTATLSFLNPRAPAVLHLDYDARADLFADIPRTITISSGSQVAHSFVPDGAGRQQTNVLLAAEMLGRRNRLEVHIAVDRLFVPANVGAGSRDTRELGI